MVSRAFRIAAWVAGIVAVLVLAFVLLFDWNWLKGPAERLAETATGRPVTIGRLEGELGRVVRIHLADLRLGNAPWAREPDMARAEAVDLAIRLGPLLTGKLALEEVILTRPVLSLEQAPDGKANWHFGGPPGPDPKPEHRGEFPVIDRLVIQDGRLAYHDPANSIAIESRIHTAAGGGSEQRPVTVEGEGTLGGQPARLFLEAGSLLKLRESDQPYPLRLAARVGDVVAQVSGTMADPARLQGMDLKVVAEGPDLAAVTPLTGVPLPRTRDFRIEGQLLRQGASWTLRGFAGRVGESDLAGGATLVTEGERPTLRANLSSRRLALADLAGFIGGQPGEKDVTKGPDRVLPDRPMAFGQLKTIDMDVAFAGLDVEAPGLPISRLEANVLLEDGVLRLDPLRMEIAQGNLAGLVRLEGGKGVPVLNIDLTLRNVNLRRFLAETSFADETSGILTGRVRLNGRGMTTAEILGAADGEISLVMQQGSLSNLLLEAAGLDLAEALGFLLTEDRAVPVRCLVADFTVGQGIATTRALVLDTADTVIVGKGRIDLGDEGLDLRLEPRPKDPSLLTARTPVQVSGRLGAPKLAVEGGEMAARGGAAVALGALLTPLAALLPFLEPGGGEDQPCAQLIRRAEGR